MAKIQNKLSKVDLKKTLKQIKKSDTKIQNGFSKSDLKKLFKLDKKTLKYIKEWEEYERMTRHISVGQY